MWLIFAGPVTNVMQFYRDNINKGYWRGTPLPRYLIANLFIKRIHVINRMHLIKCIFLTTYSNMLMRLITRVYGILATKNIDIKVRPRIS